MKTVREILAAKGHHVWSGDAGSSVFDALLLMAEKNIGAVLVTEGDRPAGIMTERDYARKVVLKSRISRETPVREIMVWNPVCVRPEQSVEDCMKIMKMPKPWPEQSKKLQICGFRQNRRLTSYSSKTVLLASVMMIFTRLWKRTQF